MRTYEATYQATPEKHGNGTFFITDCCGNQMYYTGMNPMKYHGCLCPRCFWNGVHTTLYLRGTQDAKRVIEKNGLYYGKLLENKI